MFTEWWCIHVHVHFDKDFQISHSKVNINSIKWNFHNEYCFCFVFSVKVAHATILQLSSTCWQTWQRGVNRGCCHVRPRPAAGCSPDSGTSAPRSWRDPYGQLRPAATLLAKLWSTFQDWGIDLLSRHLLVGIFRSLQTLVCSPKTKKSGMHFLTLLLSTETM